MHCLMLILLLPALNLNAGKVPFRETAAEEWNVVDDFGPVKIYDRWLKTDSHSSFRECKGTVVATCPAEKAFRFVCDPATTGQWMSGIEKNEEIARDGKEWLVYSCYKIPWPFENLEMYSRFKTRCSSAGDFEIAIHSEDECDSFPSTCRRLTDYRAHWKFRPVDDERVEITLITYTTTPPFVPLFIQDPILMAIFKNNLLRLKRKLEVENEKNNRI